MLVVESYLDFESPDAIRIKGHRIGIEHVLELYQAGRSPDEIVRDYPTLTLEEVYATILYYLHNRQDVDAYLARLDALVRRSMAESDAHPSPARQRLMALQRQREQNGGEPMSDTRAESHH